MAQSVRSCSVDRLVEVLAEQVRQIEGARRPAWGDAISSGFAGLDRLLPGGGLKRGSLVEWLCIPGAGGTGGAAGAGETGRVSGAGGTGGSFGGGGAGTLALCAAREAAAAGGAVVVIDRSRRFYPPAAVRLGLELGRLVVVRPQSDEDEAWAIDQLLRSLGVTAVWCPVAEPDDHALSPLATGGRNQRRAGADHPRRSGPRRTLLGRGAVGGRPGLRRRTKAAAAAARRAAAGPRRAERRHG